MRGVQRQRALGSSAGHPPPSEETAEPEARLVSSDPVPPAPILLRPPHGSLPQPTTWSSPSRFFLPSWLSPKDGVMGWETQLSF